MCTLGPGMKRRVRGEGRSFRESAGPGFHTLSNTPRATTLGAVLQGIRMVPTSATMNTSTHPCTAVWARTTKFVNAQLRYT